MRNSLGKLSSLVGAMKIHEALIDEELVVKKKNQPTDAFYKAVLIRESRRNLAVENDSDSEYDDIVESEYQMIEKYPLYHHCHDDRHGHHHHHHKHDITSLHHHS